MSFSIFLKGTVNPLGVQMLALNICWAFTMHLKTDGALSLCQAGVRQLHLAQHFYYHLPGLVFK